MNSDLLLTCQTLKEMVDVIENLHLYERLREWRMQKGLMTQPLLAKLHIAQVFNSCFGGKEM